MSFTLITLTPLPSRSLLNSALVSVSEEVRSRCHLKHRTAQYVIADSPSSECLGSELVSSSGVYVSPSVSTSTFLSTLSSAPSGSMSSASISPGGNSMGGGPLSAPPTTASLGRRQKSCDLLDQTAMTAARQGKNAHLTQSQVGEDGPIVVVVVVVDHFSKRGILSRADLLCYYINVTKRCNTTGRK